MKLNDVPPRWLRLNPNGICSSCAAGLPPAVINAPLDTVTDMVSGTGGQLAVGAAGTVEGLRSLPEGAGGTAPWGRDGNAAPQKS